MTTIDPNSSADLPRDDTGRITSDYEPTALEVEVCRQAICREFGNNGTDGYYIRILKAVHAAAPPPQPHLAVSDLLTTIKGFAHWHHLNEVTIAAGNKPSDSEIDLEAIAWNRITRALAASATEVRR
jgi:hypothetical protein